MGRNEENIGEKPPNLVMISDRVPTNFEALVDYSCGPDSEQFPLQVSGLITPGAELDDFDAVLTRMQLLERRLGGTVIGGPIYRYGEEGVEHSGEFSFKHFPSERTFEYCHAPYDITQLKLDPGARERYTREVMNLVESMRANILFTDNFKIVLHQIIEDLCIPVVNVHPSVLPYVKGYRPEMRAFSGENPEAYGYTFHMLNGQLDGGATLMAQRVAEPKIDETIETEEARKLHLEEQLRIRAIIAQSRFVAKVLAITASGTPRSVVRGEEAFAAEGRPDFISEKSYQDQLAREAKEQGVRVSELKPYSRVLFDIQGKDEYKTLEEILNVEAIVDPKIQTGFRKYVFTLPPGKEGSLKWAGLIDTLISAGVHQKSRVIATTEGQFVELIGGLDLAATLTALGQSFSTEPLLSRVNAARKPVEKYRVI